MANIKSAKKRIKVNETKRANNVPVKSVMKTTIKKALVNPSEETLKEANKKIDKALNSGIITKNKAARQKSRIAKKLNNNNWRKLDFKSIQKIVFLLVVDNKKLDNK